MCRDNGFARAQANYDAREPNDALCDQCGIDVDLVTEDAVEDGPLFLCGDCAVCFHCDAPAVDLSESGIHLCAGCDEFGPISEEDSGYEEILPQKFWDGIA